MLAAALHEGGASHAAEEQLRIVLAAQPDAAAAHVALGEALLAQGRLLDAAQAAGAVADDSPWAPAAMRTALFGLLAGAAADDDVAVALERAARVGLPAHECAALQSWRSVLGGDAPLPGTVPAAGAALVVTMLEALVRLEDFDGFATLLPVADALALTARERREVLARMYLRRGFLESAADEWLAAVEEHGPDARALSGLAEVAAARGLDEDAELLAREAEVLAAA
jgi:tetratricopeptide (TPR) repeat protein